MKNEEIDYKLEFLEVVKAINCRIRLDYELGLHGSYIIQREPKTKNNSAYDNFSTFSTTRGEKAYDLDYVKEELGDCRRCVLSNSRSNIVFGEGSQNASLVFVGEAPGADEDKQGRPFVGRAGQLLTKIIEAMGMSREEVYICNILKCRPPDNRNPEPDEIIACEPFLTKQIQVISPKVICALGTFAVQTLLKTDASITALRGRFHNYRGIKLMPTYHPAYLLRNAGAKKHVWEDVQKIMDFLK